MYKEDKEKYVILNIERKDKKRDTIWKYPFKFREN